jgi:site-specific recombinase XerD
VAGERGSLATLQEHLGHADLKTTTIYAKVSERATDAEARRVFKAREGA